MESCYNDHEIYRYPGEAAGLKWSDFDYNAMIVKIRRALSSDLEYKEKVRKCCNGTPIYKDLKNADRRKNREIKAARNLRINEEVKKAI